MRESLPGPSRARTRRLPAVLLLLVWGTAGSAAAQAGDRLKRGIEDAVTVDAQTAPSESLPTVTPDAYLHQLSQMRQLAETCRTAASSCNPQAVPPDERVTPDPVSQKGPHPAFAVHWDWLRHSLEEAGKTAGADRDKTLREAEVRMTQDAADLTETPPWNSTGGTEPQRRAKLILARPEFSRVHDDSYLRRLFAKALGWADRLFSGAGKLLPRAPWLTEVLEWGTLAAAAAGVLLWAWRTGRQQRLVLAAPDAERSQSWQKESDNWAERARAEAARGEWREAVHSLYWAAIVLLEGQKQWRPNRARTPREYLALLDPASARRTHLGQLTRVLERLWYGLRPATESDYAQASAVLEQLRAAG